MGWSLKAMSETSSGMRSPCATSPARTPRALIRLATKMAVGMAAGCGGDEALDALASTLDRRRDGLFVVREPGRPSVHDGLAIALPASLRGVGVGIEPDEADVSVAESGQVLDGHAAAAKVIDHDRPADAAGAPIHEHERDTPFGQTPDVSILERREGHDEPVDEAVANEALVDLVGASLVGRR